MVNLIIVIGVAAIIVAWFSRNNNNDNLGL